MKLIRPNFTWMGASLEAARARLPRWLVGEQDARGRGRGRIATRNLPDHDRVLLWSILILLTVGVIMVYSASFALADARRDPYYYLLRHCIYIGIGAVVGLVMFRVPIRAWQELAPWLFIGACILLLLVLLMPQGYEAKGGRRWLKFGFITVQPAEALKLCALLYAADFTARKTAVMHSLTRGLAPLLGAMLFAGGLLLLQPDFGTFVVVIAIAVGILFIGGMNVRWFALLLVLLAIGFTAIIALSPYRLKRVIGFMEPWQHAQQGGYQLTSSLIAFGRGEWLGQGLGHGIAKVTHLPEAHNDFIFAVIAEELGFAGVMLVIAIFAVVVMRAFAIGRRAALAERPFAALVAYGIGIWIGMQAFFNMGVAMGVLPTKGITLPLVSYGGSALLAGIGAIAILLRMDWVERQLARGLPA